VLLDEWINIYKQHARADRYRAIGYVWSRERTVIMRPDRPNLFFLRKWLSWLQVTSQRISMIRESIWLWNRSQPAASTTTPSHVSPVWDAANYFQYGSGSLSRLSSSPVKIHQVDGSWVVRRRGKCRKSSSTALTERIRLSQEYTQQPRPMRADCCQCSGTRVHLLSYTLFSPFRRCQSINQYLINQLLPK